MKKNPNVSVNLEKNEKNSTTRFFPQVDGYLEKSASETKSLNEGAFYAPAKFFSRLTPDNVVGRP